MAVFIDAYERWLSAARYQPDTIERALRILRMYLNFCADKRLEPFSHEAPEHFLADAGRRGVRPSTHLNYWKDLRMAFGFAQAQGLVARNPVDQIPRPRPSVHERERDVVYTEQQMRSLLAVCPSWHWIGVRDAAIILLLWNTGFRASEVCHLLVTDINWDDREVTVRNGKNGATYEGVFDDECAQALRLHLLRRRWDAALLFTNKDGGQLTRNALLQLLKRMGKRAGWNASTLFTHGFRHTFRNNQRDLGLDDTDVAGLLGHSTVRSTQTYSRRQAARKAKDRRRLALERTAEQPEDHAPERPWMLHDRKAAW